MDVSCNLGIGIMMFFYLLIFFYLSVLNKTLSIFIPPVSFYYFNTVNDYVKCSLQNTTLIVLKNNIASTCLVLKHSNFVIKPVTPN